MKNLFATTALLSAVSVSFVAQAAQQEATLNITGSISAPVCTIQITGESTLDFGIIDRKTLTEPINALPKTLNSGVTINCDGAAMKPSFVVVDHNQTNNAENFGLVDTNKVSVGFYTITPAVPNALNFTETNSASTTTAIRLQNDSKGYHTFVNMNDVSTAAFTITPSLFKPDNKSDLTKITGGVTFKVYTP